VDIVDVPAIGSYADALRLPGASSYRTIFRFNDTDGAYPSAGLTAYKGSLYGAMRGRSWLCESTHNGSHLIQRHVLEDDHDLPSINDAECDVLAKHRGENPPAKKQVRDGSC
jgi:hypothetical protein